MHQQTGLEMRLSSSSWSLLILHLLLVLLIAEGSSARKIIANGNKDEEQHLLLPTQDHDHSSSSSSHRIDHMDPSMNVFFRPEDLKLGKTMPIFFFKKDPSLSPKLLPKQKADSIPFSTSSLPYLLNFFSFPQDSSQAKAMEFTLTQCELEPIKGDSRFCATSLESMLDFTTTLFGSGTKLKVLTTSPLTKSNTSLMQNYTVLEAPKEILAARMIACHSMPYPYAVFYCHSHESENKLFQVLLGGENGERLQAAAVCHMDTSLWDTSHMAFQVLAAQPGTSPVCHFFTSDTLVWVPFSA